MKKKSCIVAVLGIVLLLCGFYLWKGVAHETPNAFLSKISYICIAFGCGFFGHGMGNLIADKAIRKDPNVQKQTEIEKNDERNIAISSRAKSKAYDIMTFVFGAVMVSFALMGVEMMPILLLVFAYAFVQGCAIYYRVKYNREM